MRPSGCASNGRRAAPSSKRSCRSNFPGTNLNSRPQIGALLEARGWVPEKRTEKTGQPKIDDELLETIPRALPGIRRLGRALHARAPARAAVQWQHRPGVGMSAPTGASMAASSTSARRIQPRQTPQSEPRASPKSEKGEAVRSRMPRTLSRARRLGVRHRRSGGLQDRGFAHYLHEFDSGAYAKAFLGRSGYPLAERRGAWPGRRKARARQAEQGHAAIREGAKTFRYAFLYGCGARRAGQIIGDTVRAVHQIDSANDLQQRFFGSSAHPNEAALGTDRQACARQVHGRHAGIESCAQSLQAQCSERMAARARRPPRPGASDLQRTQFHRDVHRGDHLQALACPNVHDELCARFRYGWDGDVVIVLWIHDELVCLLPAGNRRCRSARSWCGMPKRPGEHLRL